MIPDYLNNKDKEEGSYLIYQSQEEDEDHYHRQLSANTFNRIVFSVLTVTFIGGLVTMLAIFGKEWTGSSHHNVDDDGFDELCYQYPTCSNLNAKFDQYGFTNLTGWQSDSSASCCDICQSISLEEEEMSESRRNSQSLYDYLVFDQIWLPQWCNALSEGHDPTLSHPQGFTCTNSIVTQSQPQLTIHGLWPNLNDGSLSCCKGIDNSVATLNPQTVEDWSIYPLLQTNWFDPTVNSSYDSISCATCYVLNHEWQKHGSCFLYPSDDSSSDALHYFEAGLELNNRLTNYTTMINTLNGTTTTSTYLMSLFPQNINVMCDPQAKQANETFGVFLEIQTCWQSTSSDASIATKTTKAINTIKTSANEEIVWIDCPENPYQSIYSSVCPENVLISNFNI